MATAVQINAVGATMDAAIAGESWAAALNAALRLYGMLLTVPDSVVGGRDGTEIRYKPTAVAELISSLRRQQGAAAGIQTTRIQHVRASDS